MWYLAYSTLIHELSKKKYVPLEKWVKAKKLENEWIEPTNHC